RVIGTRTARCVSAPADHQRDRRPRCLPASQRALEVARCVAGSGGCAAWADAGYAEYAGFQGGWEEGRGGGAVSGVGIVVKSGVDVADATSGVEFGHGDALTRWFEQDEAKMAAEAECNRHGDGFGEGHAPEAAVAVGLVQASLVAETVKANGVARLIADRDSG